MITVGLGLDGQYMGKYCAAAMDALDSESAGRHLSIVNAELIGADARTAIRRKFPRIVHHLSNVSTTSPAGPSGKRLDQLNPVGAELGAEWCCEDAGAWNVGPFDLPYFVPPPLTQRGLAATIAGVREIQQKCTTPFALEVPSFSFVYGAVPLEEFFSAICAETSVPLVLDTGHFYSYCLATDRSVEEVWNGFPVHAVWELHVAGGRVDPSRPRRYIDTHSHPVMPSVWEVLDTALQRCLKLKAVTYEVGVSLTDDVFVKDFAKLLEKVDLSNRLRD